MKQGQKYKTVVTKGTGSKQSEKTIPTSVQEICMRCGKCQHTGKQHCSASCQKCHKCGHFQAMCQTKALKVVEMEEKEESDAEDSFVGTITESQSLQLVLEWNYGWLQLL